MGPGLNLLAGNAVGYLRKDTRTLGAAILGGERMKAAIYVRVSRPIGGESLQDQLDNAQKYVGGKDWTLVRVFRDGSSGESGDRPGISDLQEEAGRGVFDIVVFTSLSRMARGGVGSALHILRHLERAGIEWHFVEQPVLNFDSTTLKHTKDVLRAILVAVDEDYRRRISERTKAALARRKSLGIRLGRPPHLPLLRTPQQRVPPGTTEGR